VFCPVGISSVLIIGQVFQWSSGPRSIFETRSEFGSVGRWLVSSFQLMPSGLYVCLIALLLGAARLWQKKSTLPLSLGRSSSEATDASHRLQLVVYFLIFLLPFYHRTVGALVYFPSVRWLHNSAAASVCGFFAAVVIKGLEILVCVLILGRLGTGDMRASVQLPAPRHASLAFVLPLAFSALISLVPYGVARVEWAAHDFGKFTPPMLENYLDIRSALQPASLMVAFPAFAEELIFRGLLLRRLMNSYGHYRAIFLTGVIWAAFHFHGEAQAGTVGAALLRLGSRSLICVAMNYGLAWLTLRSNSIIPARIAHTISNILVLSSVNVGAAWERESRAVLWAIAAMILFRYWSPRDEEGQGVGAAEPDSVVVV
jgi:membrane protease YdiL (CAAX protease family)